MTGSSTRLATASITPPAQQLRSERLCFYLHITQLNHSLTFRSRKALLMTETELMLIAAPAMIGLSSKPKKG
jgi:hypothetical protein